MYKFFSPHGRTAHPTELADVEDPRESPLKRSHASFLSKVCLEKPWVQGKIKKNTKMVNNFHIVCNVFQLAAAAVY